MIEELLSRIRTIEELNRTDQTLRAELARQEWVVRAIRDVHPDATVRTAADQLLGLVPNSKEPDDQVRHVCRGLITAARQAGDLSSTARQTWSLATISGITAVASSVLAMIIGTKGLVPFFKDVAIVAKAHVVTRAEVPKVDFVVAVLHAAVILAFLLIRFTEFGRGKERCQEEEPLFSALRQFNRGWSLVWLSWFLLYVWLASAWAAALIFGKGFDERVVWSLADIFNMAGGVAFFYLFLVMDQPSVPLADDRDRDRGFKRSFSLVVGISCVLALLSVAGRFGLFHLEYSGPLLLSLGVAVTMAYLFGRFDSHYMQVKRWTLAPLYLYVAIQVVWFLFAGAKDGETFRAVFFCLALVLKVYLFVVVTYWLQRGYIGRHLAGAAKFWEGRTDLASA